MLSATHTCTRELATKVVMGRDVASSRKLITLPSGKGFTTSPSPFTHDSASIHCMVLALRHSRQLKGNPRTGWETDPNAILSGQKQWNEKQIALVWVGAACCPLLVRHKLFRHLRCCGQNLREPRKRAQTMNSQMAMCKEC